MAGLLLGWLLLGIIMLRARLGQASGGTTQKLDFGSWFGLGLQGLGFGLAWGWSGRGDVGLVSSLPTSAQWLLALLLTALAVASALFAGAAVRELGKQWSLTARVLEGHELVTSGPFRRVRHPIYSALLGLLVATALVRSSLPLCLLAIAIYVLGTHLRAAREERLLSTMFGARYEAYARRVPRLLPRISPAPSPGA